jgi:hypothetical protein
LAGLILAGRVGWWHSGFGAVVAVEEETKAPFSMISQDLFAVGTGRFPARQERARQGFD